MKTVAWNFHVGDSQVNQRYNIIPGCDILYKLKLYLCLSANKNKGGGGAYKGCMSPMKEISKINFNTSYNWLK